MINKNGFLKNTFLRTVDFFKDSPSRTSWPTVGFMRIILQGPNHQWTWIFFKTKLPIGVGLINIFFKDQMSNRIFKIFFLRTKWPLGFYFLHIFSRTNWQLVLHFLHIFLRTKLPIGVDLFTRTKWAIGFDLFTYFFQGPNNH